MLHSHNGCIIRKITKEDAVGVLNLVKQFNEEAVGKTLASLDYHTLSKRIAESITTEHPVIIVAVINGEVVGMIAGMIVTSYFNDYIKMALELMWYVSKKHRGTSTGKKLLIELEEYSKEKGAHTLTMIAGNYSLNSNKDKALDTLYRRLGYERLEMHYIKKLGG